MRMRQFENVAREWRCKWKDDGGGKASSQTLVDIADLVDEYLPKLKALEGAVVNRAVCGGCLDFKLCTTVPLSTFGPWEEAGGAPSLLPVYNDYVFCSCSALETCWMMQ